MTVQKWLHSVIRNVLSKRLETSSAQQSHSDFLQWLIEAKQKTSEPIDQTTLVGHCSTFLLEGFETSSSLMAFALFEVN